MPDIPESVALAQPILYLFTISNIVIIGIFVGILRWIVSSFIEALKLFGDKIMDKLDTIEDKLDNQPNPRRRRKGFGQ